jgi:uncharacterized membrane protein
MELDSLWNMLMGVHGLVPAIVGWVGLVLSAAVGVVQLTPTKVDDEFLAELKAIPVVGSLVAFVIGKSPLKLKDE